MDYKTSGVDVEAGRNFVEQIKSSVDSTRRPEVIGEMGGFGGMIGLPVGVSNPLLVAGTDGVGTKLELAQKYEFHFEVGIDLVAMCVNDVITSGAEPLFFLDYIASGSLCPTSMAEVVKGIAFACKASRCSLLGGETAEMPGFYPQGKYDLAGFCVGVVEAERLVNGNQMKIGDEIIGVASSGVHSNGFSLVRKILEIKQVNRESCFGPEQIPVIETLLKPTNLYVQLVKDLLVEKIPLSGMAHITGGGLPENLPRCFPSGLSPSINKDKWHRPQIFNWLQDSGNIPEFDLWNTFNLGVGFCLVLPPESAQLALEICDRNSLEAWVIGKVEESRGALGDKLLGLPF